MEKKSKKEWLADYAAGQCFTREESSQALGNHISPQDVWELAEKTKKPAFVKPENPDPKTNPISDRGLHSPER